MSFNGGVEEDVHAPSRLLSALAVKTSSGSVPKDLASRPEVCDWLERLAAASDAELASFASGQVTADGQTATDAARQAAEERAAAAEARAAYAEARIEEERTRAEAAEAEAAGSRSEPENVQSYGIYTHLDSPAAAEAWGWAVERRLEESAGRRAAEAGVPDVPPTCSLLEAMEQDDAELAGFASRQATLRADATDAEPETGRGARSFERSSLDIRRRRFHRTFFLLVSPPSNFFVFFFCVFFLFGGKGEGLFTTVRVHRQGHGAI